VTPVLAATAHTYWGIAALVVASLLAALIAAVRAIDRSAAALLGVAGRVAGQTAHVPELAVTAPVLGLIVDEALVQDDYMNALTDGFGGA
jgi:hypothetical protein